MCSAGRRKHYQYLFHRRLSPWYCTGRLRHQQSCHQLSHEINRGSGSLPQHPLQCRPSGNDRNWGCEKESFWGLPQSLSASYSVKQNRPAGRNRGCRSLLRQRRISLYYRSDSRRVRRLRTCYAYLRRRQKLRRFPRITCTQKRRVIYILRNFSAFYFIAVNLSCFWEKHRKTLCTVLNYVSCIPTR